MSGDVNQELVNELRKLRSGVTRVFWLMIVFVVLAVISFPFSSRYRPASQVSSWDSVQTDVRRQDYKKALAEAEVLVSREPNNYHGEAYVGLINLLMGNVKEAEAHYSKAYQLFPTEQNEKELAAVRKRLTNSTPIKLLSQ